MVQIKDYLVIDSIYARFAPGFFHEFTGNSRASKLRCTPRLFEYFNPEGRALSYPQSISLVNNRNTSSSSGDGRSWSLFNIERTEAVDPIRLRKTVQVGPARRRKKKKVLLKYMDTPDTTRMRNNIREWNKLLSRHWVDLLLSDSDQNIRHSDLVNTPPPFPEDLDLGQPSLSRKFANGSFEDGGRFYDGWWQKIPSECRQYITINWEPTRELDYRTMVASILYSIVRQPLEGDAYELDEVDRTEENREIIKDSMFILINATAGFDVPDPLPTRSDDPSTRLTWAQLTNAPKRRHAPIARYFGTGIGVKVQRTDSDIAEDVMLSMARQGILVLPVHDSFIVSWRHYERLEIEMGRAYREKLGVDPKIRVDPSFVDVELANGRKDVLCNDGDRVSGFMREIEQGPACERYIERRYDIHLVWRDLS
jgi:hypothetical protein